MRLSLSGRNGLRPVPTNSKVFLRGFMTMREKQISTSVIKYLLLTEFEVRTVSYGPSFFPLIYGPSAKRLGHKSTGKNEDP